VGNPGRLGRHELQSTAAVAVHRRRTTP
jgi:hypothetical protein